MFLIPRPHFLEESSIKLVCKKVHLVSELVDDRLKKAVEKLPLDNRGIPLKITGEQGTGEGYTLKVTNKEIQLNADGAHGVFYGIQTLRQIFENDNICELTIKDKPDFKYRGYYHDVTRGKVPKTETIKSLIDDLAYFKINSFMIYIEHAFKFKEFEGVFDETCYLDGEEIRELDEYCYDNFIDFVPSVATFGHMYELLQQDRYAHLREIDNYKPEYVFWYERMLHHTLDPLNPESFEVVKSMLDQYLPNFRSDTVHICGDEPFDLLIGKHKDMDTDGLYVDFMLKIIEYVKSKGKKVMMWGSSIQEIVGRGNTECAKRIPEDVVLMPHGYLADAPEQRVINIKKLPNPVVVSPGTSSWFRLVENVGISDKNIPRITGFAKKYELDGMLNTSWGDYGNPCSIELGMYGAVMGAEKCWNAQTDVADDEFKKTVSLLLYKQSKGAQYLYELSALAEGAEYATFVRDYSNIISTGKIDVELPDEKTLRETSEGCRAFVQKLSLQEKWEKDNYRQEMLLAAEGVAVCAELFAKTMGYSVARWTNTDDWLKKYRTMWLKKNKESELAEIEKMFRYLEGCGFADRGIKNQDATKLDKNIFW